MYVLMHFTECVPISLWKYVDDWELRVLIPEKWALLIVFGCL